MGMGDNIIVNDFMFCKDHGLEYCMRCFCDHRICNNVRIEEDTKDLADDFNLDDRTPINANGMGATSAQGEQYQCSTHNKVDCGACFDWAKHVRTEAEEAEETRQWLEKRKKWADKVDP